MRRTAIVLLAGPMASVGACWFDSSVSVGDPLPQIMCAEETDCPPGWSCVAGGRCAPDGTDPDLLAPSVASLTMPALTRPRTQIELVVTASEPLATVPVLRWDADPGFAVVEQDAVSYRFALDVAADAADAEHTLKSIDLLDPAGNAAEVDVDALLRIDATAPSVSNLSVSRARVSAQQGFSEFEVTFETDAPYDAAPAAVAALIGATVVPCASTAGGSTSHRCPGMVDSLSYAEGPLGVVALVTDEAGNLGTAATIITVDLSPPIIDAASVVVAIAGPTGSVGAGAATLVPGGTVSLGFALDEAVASAAVRASGSAGGALEFAAVVDGASVSASAPIGVVPLGSYAAFADVVDDVGNAASIAIPIPPPGLLAVDGVPSPCVAQTDAGAAVCTDADGDGFVGTGEACPTGPDCNDADPLIHPGALDIPGDGTSNACDGLVGRTIDAASGIFVSPTGREVASGAPDDPLQGLNAALGLARATGRSAVFMASGELPQVAVTVFVDGLLEPLALVGGLDSEWRPWPGERTVVRFADGAALSTAGNLVASDVELSFGSTLDVFHAGDIALRSVALRAGCPTADGCNTSLGTVIAHDSEIIAFKVSAATIRVTDSTLMWTSLFGPGGVTLVRTTAVECGIETGAQLTLASTHAAWSQAFGRDVLVVHSVVNGGFPFAAWGTFSAVNSVLDAGTTPLINDSLPTTTKLTSTDVIADCMLAASCTPLDFSSCSWPGCIGVAGSLAGVAPGFVSADDPHLMSTSVLVGAGVEPVSHGGGTMATLDIDGQCRAHPPSIGVDEP